MVRAERLLGSIEVCRRAGCSFRQLDYWVRIGLVSPTIASRGSGSQRRFDFDELRWVKTVVGMRDAGLRVETILEAVERGRIQAMLDGLERQISQWRESMPEWTRKPLIQAS